MRSRVQVTAQCGLLKFFRNTIVTFQESDLLTLAKKYEEETKQIKYDAYKLTWYMRGGLTWQDVMFHISHEDKEILGKIAKENIDLTAKAKMPLV